MAFPTLEPVERRPTASLVADVIRAGIIDGSFAPRMQLTETQLAQRLEVSRGPVREAFQRLIQEGLLISEPHRGVFVVALGPDDVEDVYVARRAIEREAARRVVERGDRAAIRRLDDLVKEMAAGARDGQWATVADADLRFHEALVEASHSPRLARMYATLLVETRLSLADLEADYADPRPLVAEHRALVRALRSGDVDEVLRQVDAHLDRASRRQADAG